MINKKVINLATKHHKWRIRKKNRTRIIKYTSLSATEDYSINHTKEKKPYEKPSLVYHLN